MNAVQRRRRLGRAVASNGNLIKAVGRDQRDAVPAHPARPQLPHRLRRRRPVARRVRQPLRQGGAHADLRQPVRRQPACTPTRASPAATTARPDHVHRSRAPTRGQVARGRPACCSRPANSSSTTSVAAAVGATRSLRDPQAVLDDVWDEYVSIDGARARLRRRHHRLARGHDARPRPRGDRTRADAARSMSASIRAAGLPHRRRRRRHVHRLRAAPPRRHRRPGEDADHSAATRPRACSRASADWPTAEGIDASATLLARDQRRSCTAPPPATTR